MIEWYDVLLGCPMMVIILAVLIRWIVIKNKSFRDVRNGYAKEIADYLKSRKFLTFNLKLSAELLAVGLIVVSVNNYIISDAGYQNDLLYAVFILQAVFIGVLLGVYCAQISVCEQLIKKDKDEEEIE